MGMSTRAETATVRYSLGRRLRALREAAGITMDTVHVRGIASRQKLGRMEKGEGPYKPADVRELCAFYNVDPEETEELHAQAEALRQGRVLNDLGTDLFPQIFGTLVDLEATANRISTYEPDAMPGLLQTADYARAVCQAYRPSHPEEVIERYVAVRLQRQKTVLAGPNNTHILAVLNEAVLARRVGGAEVTAAQLTHTCDLAATGQVDVRVLTYDSGAHAAMRGSFMLLEFPDPKLSGVVYVESSYNARVVPKPEVFDRYRANLDSLVRQAISLREYLQ